MLAASTHACSQHPRLQPAPTLAARTHACSPHPRVQPAPTLAGSTHACCHHARLQPAPNACRRDFARQRTSISPRCPAFFLSLDSLPVQPAECVKGSSSLANALFPDSLGIQRLFPVQALFLRPPHLFLLWLSRSRCPAPHVPKVHSVSVLRTKLGKSKGIVSSLSPRRDNFSRKGGVLRQMRCRCRTD